VQALLTRLSSLASPSRILTVFDVSTSMEAPVGDGTRATLARDAAKATLSLVPGDYALGLWAFAYQLENGQDWTELVPTRELDADVEGQSQRDVLDSQLDTIPDRLTPGGTGLYDTTLAAVRAAREDYDPTAVNSVLVLTDGTNEDDESGLQLEALLDTLAVEDNPERPIKVIGVALGPDADLAALQSIADATAGEAYSAVDPADLQTVLFDALRQRG
jgi:von Willebrand factor type A domain